MTTFTSLAPDAEAIVLVCAHLATGGGDGTQAGAKPFAATEWADLATKIYHSPLKTPAALLDRSVAQLQEALDLPPNDAERLRRRLDMGAGLAIELERLSSLGIWVITRADTDYPKRLRERLGRQAPPVLYGAGEPSLLQEPGVAIVGSRHVDEAALAYARTLGQRCVAAGVPVISGAAKGVDRAAMEGALDCEGGAAVAVVADSLERMIRAADVRRPIMERQLLLITPYHPRTRFTVANAMGRNKLIYGLARFGVVVESSLREGGTWAGAQEVLRRRWVPLFVRDVSDAAKGNAALLSQGAQPFPRASEDIPTHLLSVVEEQIGAEISDISLTAIRHAVGSEEQGPAEAPSSTATKEGTQLSFLESTPTDVAAAESDVPLGRRRGKSRAKSRTKRDAPMQTIPGAA